MPTLDPYSVLERVRRDVGRNALRARNGIRLATGAHPSVGCTPKDVAWRRGRTELWHYRNDDVRFTPPLLIVFSRTLGIDGAALAWFAANAVAALAVAPSLVRIVRTGAPEPVHSQPRHGIFSAAG